MNRGVKKLLSLFVSFMMLFSLVTTKTALANTGYTLKGWHKANNLWTTGAIKGYMELDWVDLKVGINSYDGVPTTFTVQLDRLNGGIVGYQAVKDAFLYAGLADVNPGSEPVAIDGGFSISPAVPVGNYLQFALTIEDTAKFIGIGSFTLKFQAQLSDNAAEWPGASLQFRMLESGDKTVSMMRNEIIMLGDLTINKTLLDANGAILNESRVFDIVISNNLGTPPIETTVTSGSSVTIYNLLPGTYTVTEPGYGTLYETVISNGGVAVFTGKIPDLTINISNKIKVPVIDVTATKVWVGGPTPRPEVQLQLYRRISGGADAAVGDVKNLPDGTLQVTWTGMPSTDPQGNPYIYTVKEVGTPTNYSKSEVGITVTNTYVPPKENITANKIWVGGPTPRPAIAFQLYRSVLGGAAVAVGDPKNLADGVIEVTWNDMPKTDMNGNPYTYTVKEVGTPDNYTKSEVGLTVTNTYVPPTDNITATKVWVGGPTPRPAITFQLYRSVLGAPAIPVEAPKDLVNGVLQVTWNSLPLTDGNGNPYTYTVREVGTPANYTKSEVGLTVTNTYVPPKTDITANKIWVGGPTPRPTVTFQLYRSVLGGAAVPVEAPKDLVNGVLQVTWNNVPETDNDGNPYTYTVQEVGTPANYSKSEDGLTVTNTYVPPKRDITAAKVWVGGPSPRPTITFQLYRSVLGGAAVPVEAPKDLVDGTLQVTWSQLPLTDGDGNEYTYSVKEVGTPANYTKDESGLTVTNTYVSPKVDVKAIKVWVGGASPRPTVTFQLYRSVLGGEAVPVESPKDLVNGVLEVTWLQLPTTDGDGNPYTYSVKEVGTPLNYTKGETGLTVTNTYHSPLIDVSGTKIWVGGPSPRPDIELQLYRRIQGGVDAPVRSPITIKDGTTSYKWEDVEEFDGDGIPYIYTIKEVGTPLNYSKVESGLTVTNTYHSPLIDVTGTKIWVGGPSPRPDIELQLYRKIVAGPEMTVGQPVTLKDGTTTYKWEDIEEFNNDGVPYIYFIKEIGTPTNYTKSEEGMTVTNRYNSPLIDVTGEKIWVGGPSPRPDIELQLFRQIAGEAKVPIGDPVKLVDGTTTYKWEGVPQYNDDGVPYLYTVDEVAVPENYSKALDGMEVTNTYHSPLIDVTGTKVWAGGPSPRPDIELQLYRRIQGGMDAPVETPVTIKDGTTTYKWEDVEEFNNDGIPYIYTVKEVKAPENYTESEDGMTVTNTYNSPLTDVTGTKIWMGGPSPRPAIELQLWRMIPDGEPEKVGEPVELTDGTTEYVWEDVPLTDFDGVPYEYYVEEVVTGENYEKIEEGMEVTNEYVSPKTYVTVEKIWVGGPEPRPTIYIQLYRKVADGEKMMVGDPVALVSGTNEYTWNNLDVTDYDGKPYIYSVEEADVAGYVKVVEGFEISNTRIKGNIEFHKHDDAHMPLAGAVFGLYAVTDTMFAAPLKTATSLADGLVRFTDVEYGEYKIKEISAPVGYEKSELVIPVAVTMQGATVVPTPATVVNVKIMGDITLRKVDSVTDAVLAGAKIVIKDKAGTVVFEGTTGADGMLKVMLPYGEYIISEVAAPEGYILTTQTYSVNVNKSGLTFDVRIPNTEEEELPQTGGIPSELLYLMGAMAIIGGVILMKGKRRTIG